VGIPTGFLGLKSLVSGGNERTYSLYVPSTYNPSQSYPLVFDIHWYKGTVAQLDNVTGMSKLAEEFGFILLLPEGTDGWWKDGDPGWPADEITLADEVTFISDLIDEVSAQYNVDPLRIYVTGVSNGGCMSYSLACELGDRIAAIGPVVGALILDDCKPEHLMPVIHIHGADDPMFKGIRGTTGRPTDVQATLAEWAARNGCSGETEVVYQQGKATCTAYTNCDENATVELCVVEGLGHEWPSGSDIDASRAIWEFFAAHPMPEQ
jgi:polyhydroxybutyrate depolymerase